MLDEQSTRNRTVFNSEGMVRRFSSKSDLPACERSLIEEFIPPGMRILDAGIGAGRTTTYLAPQAARYVGFDYAPAMIEAARSRFPGVDLRVADATDLAGFDDRSFDAVMFSFNGLDYLHPERDRARALAGFFRVLVPGGVLVFSTHNPRAILRRPWTGEVAERGRLRAWRAAARRTLTASTLVMRSPFWRGHGYAKDPFRPLVNYFATRSHVAAELDSAGFDIEKVVGSDAPRWSPSLVTPWFYYACRRRDEAPAIAGAGPDQTGAG